MNQIGKIIFSVGLAIISFFGYHQTTTAPQSFGSFTPIGTTNFTLAGAGITSTANTIQLTSFLLPDRVTPITMSMIGAIGYGVLEPQSSKIEDITFTGVTQNANGSALLTGVSRGISFYSPYQASTTLAMSHAGGATFIISNTAGFYGQQFAFTNNPTGVNSLWTFTDPPILTNTATSGLQAASVNYVNSVAFGSVPVLVSSGGTGQTSLPLDMFLVGNGVAPIKSTSTPTVAFIVATSSNPSAFSGGLLSFASSTFTSSVSVAASNVSTRPWIANLLAYAWPAFRGASSTVLTENGSGTLIFQQPQRYTLYQNTNVGFSSSATASTTALTIPIPANTITGGNGEIKVESSWFTDAAVNGCDAEIRFGTGAATTSLISGTVGNTLPGTITTNIMATSTTNEYTYGQLMPVVMGNGGVTVKAYAQYTVVPLTAISYLDFLLKARNAGDTCKLNGVSVTVDKQ